MHMYTHTYIPNQELVADPSKLQAARAGAPA